MKTATLNKGIEYNETKPTIHVMLETEGTKEIRIAMKTGQFMKEHKTAFPIVVEMFEGKLDFGVKGEILNLERGDMLALEGNVPHDLVCTEDCIVRLSLSKLDKVERVLDVVK
jgi:quercetin dioxygenase-like cupin family protein